MEGQAEYNLLALAGYDYISFSEKISNVVKE
jgi:hypothetical protein